MNSKERQREEKVRLEPAKKDGEELLRIIEGGDMAAILSKNEVMYVYFNRDYRCYIHPLGAEEGRCHAFAKNTQNRAIIKNLAELADQIFRVVYKKNMDPIGVMVAAENGIIAYLDATGQLPAEDVDFMSWQDAPDDSENEGG